MELVNKWVDVMKNLRFPALYILEILLYAPLFAGCIGAIFFIAARPISEFDLHGKALPATWEAAVPNHGRYLPGFLIRDHPFMFIGVVALALVAGTFLQFVRTARAEQASMAKGDQARHHRIAAICVFAVWGIMVYVLFMHILVEVAPT